MLLSPSQQQQQKRRKKLSLGGSGNGNWSPFLLGRGTSNHMNQNGSNKAKVETQTMPLPSQRQRKRNTSPRDLATYRKAWDALMIRSRNHASRPSPKENVAVVTELFARAIQFGKISLYDDEGRFDNRTSLTSV